MIFVEFYGNKEICGIRISLANGRNNSIYLTSLRV
jgi:hypothetical protein